MPTAAELTAIKEATEKAIVALNAYLVTAPDDVPSEQQRFRSEMDNAYRANINFLGYIQAHSAIQESKK